MERPDPIFNSWLDSPAHRQWRLDEAWRLARFAKAARLDEGFGPLDDEGRLADDRAQTLITTRMTHSFALAHLSGLPGFGPLVEHGVRALLGTLRDQTHGGWFAQAQGEGDDGKAAYLHAFVALAASSATVTGCVGAQALLTEAVRVIDTHFWQEGEGAMAEAYDRTWSVPEAYRGANSNMHSVEAFLALADVTGNPLWLERALRICERLIRDHAMNNRHRVIEHFDQHWQPRLDYNQAQPADPFRPYGSTPGHAFEWARLLLHLEGALQRRGLDAPQWLLDAARQLFAAACDSAWAADGAPGLVYTLDWQDQPVVRQRMHWVHAEASAAAAALLIRTGERHYEDWYRRYWDFTEHYLIDRMQGSWYHELDEQNRPSAQVWAGKPDLYHALQAVLLPGLPLAVSIASALAAQG